MDCPFSIGWSVPKFWADGGPVWNQDGGAVLRQGGES